MRTNVHIKKGDNVIVLSGEDKGKKGKVLSVIPEERKVIVEGVNMVSKHKKARKQTDTSGIIKQEAPLYASKVMHICNKCGKPTRIGHKLLADGKKARICKNCLEVFEN
ncbi:MAG: 50S ribosomal protein L24 [Ruminococcaceae bacterium]|nr:50S ribosomal protein L24 [Oscillospiraceae bacterium]